MAEKKHTRRDFLKGTAARDRLADRLEQAADQIAESGSANASPACFLRIERPAMGGHFEVFLNAGQYDHGTEAALAALDEVDRLEQLLSFFRATSQIGQINQLAADGPVSVDPDVFELLQWAVGLNHETDGALDITAGPLSEVWGFSRREGKIPDQQQLDEALTRVGCDKLELDAENQTVRFTVPGMQINLGAIGKGYALDRASAILMDQGIEHFMIHGGQSSIVAQGSALTADGRSTGWTVGVHDPTRHDRRLAEIRLFDRAIGTSGSEKQFFRYQGRRLGHVLDPRTGWPAEGLLSATVVAPTAALADGLSTALFVLGEEKGTALCDCRGDVAVLLVDTKGNHIECKHFGPERGALVSYSK